MIGGMVQMQIYFCTDVPTTDYRRTSAAGLASTATGGMGPPPCRESAQLFCH